MTGHACGGSYIIHGRMIFRSNTSESWDVSHHYALYGRGSAIMVRSVRCEGNSCDTHAEHAADLCCVSAETNVMAILLTTCRHTARAALGLLWALHCLQMEAKAQSVKSMQGIHVCRCLDSGKVHWGL